MGQKRIIDGAGCPYIGQLTGCSLTIGQLLIVHLQGSQSVNHLLTGSAHIGRHHNHTDYVLLQGTLMLELVKTVNKYVQAFVSVFITTADPHKQRIFRQLIAKHSASYLEQLTTALVSGP